MIGIFLLTCLLGITPENRQNQHGYQQDVRRMLIDWNKATLKSLTNQYQSASDEKKRARYAQRLAEFQSNNECKSRQLIDTASVRYKFLAMFLSKKKNREVFIVEANRMGATAIIRNYVVWGLDNGGVKVDYYFFSNENEWLKEDFTMTIPKADISLPLSSYLVKSSEGVNYDDVIISHFAASDTGKVTSEFFSLGTLSRKCAVKGM
ncbi:hypothetical protein L3C95_19920 [Chitinophaga filiformis]|uniref:hypothetical protein n=1 Tax=Chitinophaga filiformis TaxID=104663 RepID=UPI001F45BD7C|nr:hypothetical protein [Chitinophaga filiformis]MCF6405181.1 hypothetical protein [Chitinophaga filiformis]